MLRALRSHWPEYLIEAALLGLFMISASVFTILFEHPASPVVTMLPDSLLRRMLIGIAMGATALALILSPIGKRSGAHFNPAVTLTFWRLGKMEHWDAVFYVVAQFLGGAAGVPRRCRSRSANALRSICFVYRHGSPGRRALGPLSPRNLRSRSSMMLAILSASNVPRFARFTPLVSGTLVAAFVTFEAPLSGMSMNPARTFGSGFVGHIWTAFWIYLIAPVLAMQLAATIYRLSGRTVHCAKLHHHNGERCIFHCAFGRLLEEEQRQSQGDASM